MDRKTQRALVAQALDKEGGLSQVDAERLAATLGISLRTVRRYQSLAREDAPAPAPGPQLVQLPPPQTRPADPPPDLEPGFDWSAMSLEDALAFLAGQLTPYLVSGRGDWAASNAKTIQALLTQRAEILKANRRPDTIDPAEAAAALAKLKAQLPPRLRRVLDQAAG